MVEGSTPELSSSAAGNLQLVPTRSRSDGGDCLYGANGKNAANGKNGRKVANSIKIFVETGLYP